MTVRFDDKHVVYDSSELDELVLAYAATIHKARGCEFPYVIMPLMKFYTAVTRSQKGLAIVGERIERHAELAQRLTVMTQD